MKYGFKIFLLILVLRITDFSYGQNNIDDYFQNNQFKVFKHEIKGVEIKIDPRIEFFQVINLVGGNPAINTTEMNYKLDIIRYFEKYKNHEALGYLKNNFGKFFTSIDGPYSFLLCLNNDFTFRKDVVNNKWRDFPEIDTYLKMMRLFMVETDFVRFFNGQENFYNLVLDNTDFTLNDFDEKNRILDYFGIEKADEHKFCLILNFLGFGNFGKGFFTPGGEEHYAIVSASSGNGSIPVFEKNQILALMWHEFGHSFSNPLVDKYWDDFNNLSHLLEPIKQSMAGQYYQDWHSVVYEHMVRAVTCRLCAIKYSEDFAQVNLNRLEIGKKFIYTIPIISALKEYEQSRLKYPTLDSFMPEIITALKSVKQDSINNWLSMALQIREPDISDIPSNGEIYNRDNRLLILATNEEDPAADKRLKEFVAKSCTNYKTVADTTALEMDLSGYNLFAIGTPWGNKFIEKYISLLPVKITRQGLVAQNLYEGNGYAFITGWINPFNPDNIMVIYTAQDPDDLVNFTWIPRGDTDYQIIKNMITLRKDDYKRNNLIWGCY